VGKLAVEVVDEDEADRARVERVPELLHPVDEPTALRGRRRRD